jgi:eukaryotic-like serine/threonine-protein kinase
MYPAPQLRVGDRFELKAQAGRGGMGTVYKAIDRRTGSLVAIKILHVQSVTDIGRFDQEAALLRELQHPGIVHYIDHGLTSQGDPYIAMEWLAGETLEQRLGQGVLPAAGVAHVAGRVLEALAAAHVRGIVHRDVKPSNIFLVGWRLFDVRILDFGVARRVLDPKRFTRQGATVGTPLYSAPEQARGEANLDGRADIFSLGCVLFECLTGRPPFSGKSAQDVMTQICIGAVPDLRDRCKEVDPELAWLVQRMLAQDRRQRPGDAGELGREFRALAARLGSTQELEAPSDGAASASRSQLLGFSERRVLCGLVLSFERPFPTSGSSLDTLRADAVGAKNEDDLRASAVRKAAQEAGASAELFSRGTFILTPAAGGPIGDQVRDMARMALRLAESFPQARQCLGVGRAMLLAGLPVGDLVERLPALLPEAPGVVRLDELAARLLPRRLLRQDAEGSRFLATASDQATETAFGSTDSGGLPFVGRERELSVLLGTLEESSEEEVARSVLVLAGPGAGKTRLARELTSRARQSGTVRLFLLRARIERAGARCGLLASLFAQAGVSLREDTQRPALETALLKYLGGLCGTGPVAILCDDLQWADRLSVQLLDAALRELRQRPFAVLGFGRPEVEHQFPGLWRERNVERTRLPPMSRRAGQQLLKWHLPMASALEEEFVLDRWEGNPFLLAELAKEAESNVPPDTVLGTVEARLLAFDEEPRRVLRAASLFGDRFEVEGLVAVMGERNRASVHECLAVLVEADLVRRAMNEGEGVYVFRHKLVREAAHAMLTPSDRTLGSEGARRWLEAAGKTLPEFLAVKASAGSAL